MESIFEEELKETYSKTLELAVNITQNKAALLNTKVTNNDLKFVKKIAKGCKDFEELPEGKRKRSKILEKIDNSQILSPIRSERSAKLLRNSGKHKLNIFLEERKKYVSGSKAGKPLRYAAVGPSVIEKIRTSNFIYLDDSIRASPSERTGLLPHVSIRTGKIKDPIELPSFKDYVKLEKVKNPNDEAFERIDQCNKKLDDFSKELTGLETFISHNPGVQWNSDKKVLLQLHDFPEQKHLIIKAYNDQHQSSILRRRMTKKISNHIKEKKTKDDFQSKTPNPQAMIDSFLKKAQKITEDPGEVVRRCYARFRKAQENQDKKLISILESLNSTRAMHLKQKAQHIYNDTEKFKDKSYSLIKMSQIKKHLDLEQKIRLKKRKKQVVIYGRMMEFLKSKGPNPSEAEVNFIEILREILEEGWCISEGLIEEILSVTSEEDQNDIGLLVDFLMLELQKQRRRSHD